MSADTPLDDSHPLKKAWDAYQKTGEYENSRKWATALASNPYPHLTGSLWAVFAEGYAAGRRDAEAEKGGERE